MAAQLLDTVILEDGSQALVFHADAPGYQLDEGKEYAFEQDDKKFVGEAIEIGEGEVTLGLDDGTKVVVNREELGGMVVHIYKRPE